MLFQRLRHWNLFHLGTAALTDAEIYSAFKTPHDLSNRWFSPLHPEGVLKLIAPSSAYLGAVTARNITKLLLITDRS